MRYDGYGRTRWEPRQPGLFGSGEDRVEDEVVLVAPGVEGTVRVADVAAAFVAMNSDQQAAVLRLVAGGFDAIGNLGPDFQLASIGEAVDKDPAVVHFTERLANWCRDPEAEGDW